MPTSDLTRREALKTTSAALAALFANLSRPEFVFPGEVPGEELVPFLNMPQAKPKMLDWETLDNWITPQEQVFSVSHYNEPEIKPADYRLEIAGLVEHPKTFTLDELKALPKQDQLMTLECSGNGAGKGFLGAVYNSKWTGTSLSGILTACGVKARAKELVFFG